MLRKPFRLNVKANSFPEFQQFPQIEHHQTQAVKKQTRNFPTLLSFGEFLKDVDRRNINKVIMTENESKIETFSKDGQDRFVFVPKERSSYTFDKLASHDVIIEYKQNDVEKMLDSIGAILQYSVVVFMIGATIFILQKSGSTGGSSPMTFGKSKAVLHSNKSNVSFNDIGGLESVKLELMEVVDFLKNPDKYSVIGAKIPKGVLLISLPGCGKTALAKAVAGEADVPFYSCSASEFIEMFVGVGASRVRDMFKIASANSPCIIFIDEIDAVGRARGSSNSMGNNDEREQTINQLLTEMDGFKENSGVIVIAATNRVEILDPALLRPGRFDRQIHIDLPDLKGRLAILKVHTKNKPLDDDVSLDSISRITTGYSGADLANLANEAAILTARRNKSKIGLKEFDDSIERILLGLEKDGLFSPEKRKLIAYHEAGHALVALKVGEFDNVRKVTIIPRGNAGGVTIFEPNENNLHSKEYFLNQITVALGGRVAEELLYGDKQITNGASNDIEKVYHIARLMVTSFGLSEKIGPIACHTSHTSEILKAAIDHEIYMIVMECLEKARSIVKENKHMLDIIVKKLLEVETISGDELIGLIYSNDFKLIFKDYTNT